MKKWSVLVLALLVFGAGAAGATNVGVGVFAGASVPILQDDNARGSMFGVRVPLNLIPFFTVEPYYARSMLGDAKQTFGGFEYTRSGFDVTSFGVNAALGSLGLTTGFSFYPYAGIGSHKLSRDGTSDVTETGYNFGLGLGISPAPVIAFNLRGELEMIKTGDTSRKFVNVTLGATYKFFPLP
jgi:hypothetical protein